MKRRKSIIALLICLVAALFACGIFSLFIKDKDIITAEAAEATPTPITQTIYWEVSGNTLTLSSTTLSNSFSADDKFVPGMMVPWYSYRENITTVNIKDPIAPKFTIYWFYECSKLDTIINLSYLDTSNVIDMSGMFFACNSLTSLDLSSFDTANVTRMGSVFQLCKNLKSVTFSDKFITSKVTYMGGLFCYCESLTGVDLSGFDTSSVADMEAMFYGCHSLEVLNLGKFDCSSLDATSLLFNDMPGLKKIRLSDTLAAKIAAATADKKTAITLPLYDADGTPCTEESQFKGGGYFKEKHTHDYKFTKTVAPTCLAGGYDLYTCSEVICSKTEHRNLTPTGDHDWNDWHTTKNATVDEAGEEQRECQRTGCRATETRAIPKLEHAHVWQSLTNDGWVVTKPATCVEQGEEERVCTAANCTLTGSKETREIPVDNTAHDFDTATWKNDGTNHWHACKRTGCTAKDGNVGHTAGAAATCTTAQTCTVCDYEIAAALGHNYVAEPGGVAPTCTTAGSGKVKCSRCHDEKSGDSIPALGHTEVVDAGVAATCTTAGKTEGKHCSVCNEVTVAQTDIPALGHNWATEWSKDETNHWHKCTRCEEINDEAAHVLDWVITKTPTETEEGEKEEYCTVCEYKTGNKQPIAKLVSDEGGSGSVIDLPTGNDYDLEIAVKESDSLYNVEGVNKGYKVELYVVDGETRNPYDSTKTVTLMLAIPEGMEETFSLYLRKGEILERVPAEKYSVEGRIVTIRTTLPSEYVFNAPAPEEPEPEGIPWWVWLIVGLGAATLITVIIVAVVFAKKKRAGDDDGSGEPTVIMQGSDYDDAALKAQLAEQNKRLEDLENRDDGGFNAPYDGDL